MAVKCPKCHTDNPDTSLFCSGCGTKLEAAGEFSLFQTETLETSLKELATGSTFAGRYQIIEELGKGGMGKVYKVLDTHINEKVALKLLKPEIAADKKTIERFSNELKFARRIRHKNVCGMYDLGKAEGTNFITMEYIQGEDLKSMIRMAAGLSIGAVLSIGKQICDGLAEAHALGVVHRDLKPQNIMIDKGGNAKIMDFGIARSIREKGITGPSVLIGTPEYMSPEQAEAKEVDSRSDIYSLGIILYEMATGRVPFEGDTALSIAMKHKGEIPKDPKQLNPSIPEDLSRVILRCLEKDKSNRYQTATEVRSELEKIEKAIPTAERVVPEKRTLTSREITVKFNLRKLLIPTGIILLAVCAASVFFFKSRGPHFEPSRVIVAAFENQTGDRSLDPIGRMASDWISQGLSKTGLVEVVSVPPGETAPGTAKEEERLRALAKESGAGTLVSGTYFLQGKTLSFHSQISDMSKRKVLKALDPVSGPVEEPLNAIETLRQKVMGALALISNPDITPYINIISSLPNYEAYKEYIEGVESSSRGDWRGRIEHSSRAAELDQNFLSAVLEAAMGHFELGYEDSDPSEFTRAEELVKKVDESREALSPQDRLYLDWVKANLRGDQPEKLRLARQLAPTIGWNIETLAIEEMRSNHPREAIKAISKLDPAGVFEKGSTNYWWIMTTAYHMLGEHKQELREARRGRRQYPEVGDVLWLEARALAALGRIEEINTLVNESLGMPAKRVRNPGMLMILAEGVLKFNGFKRESLQLVERAIKWLEARPNEEIKTKAYRFELATAFYLAERLEDARTIIEVLLKDDPENVEYIAACGRLAAKRGDREEAPRISKQLEDLKRPYLFGNNTYGRAIIASLLGEKEDAVRLLQEALSQGFYIDVFLNDCDLEPLHDYPPFKELMKPKG